MINSTSMLLTGNRKLQIEEVKRNPEEYYKSIGEMCGGEQGETVWDAPHGKFCNTKVSRHLPLAAYSSSRGCPYNREYEFVYTSKYNQFLTQYSSTIVTMCKIDSFGRKM